jgi:hypothetical protein
MSQGLIEDDNRCHKKIKEIEVKEIIATTIEEPEISNDFDIVFNNDEINIENTNFSFNNINSEKDVEDKKEMIDRINEIDLDELSEEKNDSEIEYKKESESEDELSEEKNEQLSSSKNIDSISSLEEIIPENKSEIKETEFNTNNLSMDDISEMSSNSSAISEMSNSEQLGGSFVYNTNSNAKYLVFIYDNHDPDTMQKKFGKSVVMNEALIVNFFRAFDDKECTLIEEKGESTKGYSITLTSKQFKDFIDSTNGYKPFQVTIQDKAGNKFKGVSYQKDIEMLSNEPENRYMKKVYNTVEYGWTKAHMDEKGIIYIYDKKHNLRGTFNYVNYFEKGTEKERLSKVKISSKNPFLDRLQEREPIIFGQVGEKENKYSRACPWTDRRQPVILTKEEKEEIDLIAPGSYESVIEYASDPKKPYYYICPRYWDFLNMRPVEPDKVDKSKLISTTATGKEIMANITSKYIMELSHKGDFHTRVGYLTKYKTKDGLFVPCCFTQKDTNTTRTKKTLNQVGKFIQNATDQYELKKKQNEESEKELIESEIKDNETLPSVRKIKISKKIEAVKHINYILDGDKFPLEEHRRGHLTPILEKFFQMKHTECYSNLQKHKLKLNTHCLLRCGVQIDENQSFLAAMSFILYSTPVSIEELKKNIINVLNIDNIQSFHGGNIVHTFSDSAYENQDISEYTKSNLYKEFRSNIIAFKKIVNGYENFKKYLLSDEYIDYTYLWDIMCGGLLYRNKFNLVILHEDHEDPTHNLSIVCPSTTHSDYRFNPKLSTCILYRCRNYFEPIFSYYSTEKEYKEIKFFNIESQIPILSKILKKINEHIGDYCKEKVVNPKYMFKMNLYVDQMIKEIQKINGYTVKKQIMNLDGRIIGIIVSHDKDDFYVPCRSSQVSGDYELLNDTIWNNYNKTIYWLEKLYKDSKGKIPCKPKMRMIEDEMVIGILTETNQMIPLEVPEENTMNDNLQEVRDYNHITYDQYISSHPMKEEKAKAIQYLKLEQSFYSAFYNTLKIYINDIINLSIKLNIESILKSEESYNNKIEKIKSLISPVITNLFEFVEYDPKILENIKEINVCKNKDQEYCNFEDKSGKLLIPIYNLFNRTENNTLYINRFVDDLVLNLHIQHKFFNELNSTIFYTEKFNLSKNEILLLEKEINSYYNDNYRSIKTIPSINHLTIEDVQPSEILEVVHNKELNEPEEEEIQLDTLKQTKSEIVDVNKKDIIEEDYSSDEDEKVIPNKKELSPILEEATIETKEPTIEPIEPEIKPSEYINTDTIQNNLSMNVPAEVIQQKIKRTIKLIRKSNTQDKPNNQEIESAKEEIKEAVEMADRLHKKEKSPVSEDILIEAKEAEQQLIHLSEPSISDQPTKRKIKITQFKNKKEIQQTQIDPAWRECIKDTSYLTTGWKKYFPKGTRDFRIGVGKTYNSGEHNINCNFHLILTILKDYNNEIYRDYKLSDIKQMLIKMYNDYSNYRQFIMLKWKREKPTIYPYTKETTIEKIILSETYEFTEVDMALMIFYYDLPIVLFNQAKGKVKMLKRINHQEDYCYYIKMKGINIFMLYNYHEKTYKIYDIDLNPDHKKDIINPNMKLIDYLENDEFLV